MQHILLLDHYILLSLANLIRINKSFIVITKVCDGLHRWFFLIILAKFFKAPFYKAPPGNCFYISLVLCLRCFTFLAINESSRPELFCKKGVLRKFAKFTGKHLCQSLFFDKIADLRQSDCLSTYIFSFTILNIR